MNLRSLTCLALLAMLPLTGCLVVSSRPRAAGDVTFRWSFAGQSCAMVPAVKNVKITIGGQTLQNDGVFDCSTNGTAGIVLHDFKGGGYNYTIQGRDYNGTVLYSAEGAFIIDGSVTESVDLKPVGNGAAYAYMVWTFPPNSASSNPTCAQAGVAKVNVSIDQGDWLVYDCAAGQTVEGTPTPYLTVGSHNIELSAVNSSGYEYYFKLSTLPVSNTPSLQQYDLDWAVGGATVKWTVTNGSTATTCAAAGITTVYVNFRDSNGDLVYTGSGDPQPCANLAIVYNFLKPGNYQVFLSANGSGTSVYQSSTTSPPVVSVAAGVFTDINAGSSILLNRVQ